MGVYEGRGQLGKSMKELMNAWLETRSSWKDANAEQSIKDLRDKALVETDPAERTKIFAAIQDYLQQNGPWAPFVQSGVNVGLNAGLKGFVYSPQWTVDVALLSK